MTSYRGFFGKLPARGDFVSAGLPRDFVSRWDGWISGVLPAALEAVGDRWLEAPVWRFDLARGVCGAVSVAGLLVPSADKVGRRFPLTLAWLGDGVDDAAMSTAEQLGRTVIAEALAPDLLAERLAEIPSGAAMQAPAAGGRWWVVDGERGKSPSLSLAELPDAGQFKTMMTGEAQ